MLRSLVGSEMCIRDSRRRSRAQTMMPASKSIGVLCLSESSVARLIYTMGFMEPSDCSCLRAAPNPSMQASQHTWNGREPSATASPNGENQNLRSRKLRQDLSYQFFHSGKLDLLPEKRVKRTEALGQMGQKIAVIVDTIHQCTDLLHIRGHRHLG